MEEMLVIKLPLQLRDIPAENMQRRKLDPPLDNHKHDERAHEALHVHCENSFKSEPGFFLFFFLVNASLYRQGAHIVSLVSPLMASVTFLPSGHLLFRDEAEQLNGRLNQVKNKAALTSSNKEGGKKKSAQIECFDRHITVVLCCALIEDTKEEVSDCLHLDTLDKTTSGDWSDLHHSPNADSVSHTAEMQDASPLSPAATGAYNRSVCC